MVAPRRAPGDRFAPIEPVRRHSPSAGEKRRDHGHLQRLASNGVGFHSYTEPMLSTDNEMVRDIVLAVMASLASKAHAGAIKVIEHIGDCQDGQKPQHNLAECGMPKSSGSHPASADVPAGEPRSLRSDWRVVVAPAVYGGSCAIAAVRSRWSS